MQKSTKEMAQLLKVSLGTFRNQYANNLQKINERLEQLGLPYRVKEKKKIGRTVVFILESSGSPSGAPSSGPISLHHPSTPPQEAGSPPPASISLTEHEKEILNALKGDEKEKLWKKLIVVKSGGSVNERAKRFGLPKSTVSRWVKAYSEKGVIGLIDFKKEPKEIPEAIKKEAVKLYANSQMPISVIYRKLEMLMLELGEFVSYEKLKEFLKGFEKEHIYEVTRRKYGRSAAMKFRAKIGRWKKDSPFAVWQADHTTMDNFVVFPNGKVERPVFSAVVDEATGYILSWRLLPKKVPSASDTTFLFIEAIERWGLPKAIRIDNGKDFVSKRVLSGFEALGVEVRRCWPKAPWEKGHVENFMGIIKKNFCPQLVECYSYRDPRQREALPKEKAKPMPWEHYVAKLSDFIKDRNAQIAHEKRLTIPEEPAGFNPLAYYYFLEETKRSVDRGEIHIDGITYRAKELLNPKWFGEKVVCKLDDSNAGHIWVFTESGEFICEAFADGTAVAVPLEELRQERKRLAKNRKVIARAREEIVKVKTKQRARELEELRADQERYKELNQKKESWDRALREIEKKETLKVPEVFRPGEVITFLYENLSRISEVPEEVIERFNEEKEIPRFKNLYREEIEAVEKALSTAREV